MALTPITATVRLLQRQALWYGWSEMQRDLTEIKELAAEMRRERRGVTLKPALK